MSGQAKQRIYLKDYRVSAYTIPKVHLDISLNPKKTKVLARFSVHPHPERQKKAPLILSGEEVTLDNIWIDGTSVLSDIHLADNHLVITQPPPYPFELKIETSLNPSTNVQLMGLYYVHNYYCTQCEPEGFRRITYFLDRPDILSIYTTRLEAERREVPILLSNGNLIDFGHMPDSSRHFALWHDPYPKPSYLFALVGGDFAVRRDQFLTRSNRKVDLALYVEHSKESQTSYAMESLKAAMIWDEKTYGCEYDLDVFNIVAVSHFTMGAMENKGLNIFNDKYVLCSETTATDKDFAGIESVIAHEYFHNWTGNRITCRDWFQLCLKEGLTVFRDQTFSADQNSPLVERIEEVSYLRNTQFPEDAGPLAHPVRPLSYQEINNFYTATVYDKGAEIIRVLKTLIGDSAFYAGMHIYFRRFDGTAATIEDFLSCFAISAKRDLNPFKRWYEQSGTPHLQVQTHYLAQEQTLTLTFQQHTEPTQDQGTKEPFVIPIALSFISQEGEEVSLKSLHIPPKEASKEEIERGLLEFTTPTREITFSHVSKPLVPSVLRNFSAPVHLDMDLGDEDLLLLARHDTDGFNRWQSLQMYFMRFLRKAIEQGSSRKDFYDEHDPRIKALSDLFRHILTHYLEISTQNASSKRKAPLYEPAFLAQMLRVPDELAIAQEIKENIDPDLIYAVREQLRISLRSPLESLLVELYEHLAQDRISTHTSPYWERRALKDSILSLLSAGQNSVGAELAQVQFTSAQNMTDRLSAAYVLNRMPKALREKMLADFHDLYVQEPLALDKWFMLQAVSHEENALEAVKSLTHHPAFSFTNPNRVYALLHSFSKQNPTRFHRSDGESYRFLGEMIVKLDAINSQVAARLLTTFSQWKRLEAQRQARALETLEHLRKQASFSSDVQDILSRLI